MNSSPEMIASSCIMNDRISVPTTAAAELWVTVDSRNAIAAIAISGMK